MSRRAPSPLVALGVVSWLSAVACNSDASLDLDPTTSTGDETTGTSTGTTAVPTTGEVTTTTGVDETTGTTAAPPPDTSCDEFLACLGPCALSADIMCILGCTEGLPPDEAAKVGQLLVCVGQVCFDSGACSPDTLQDPICLACIAFGLMNKHPPGCEEQADACYP